MTTLSPTPLVTAVALMRMNLHDIPITPKQFRREKQGAFDSFVSRAKCGAAEVD